MIGSLMAQTHQEKIKQEKNRLSMPEKISQINLAVKPAPVF